MAENKQWLQLSEYSNKYEVSVSTLRRRIKEQSIEFKLDDGKYFVLDEPPTVKNRGRKPLFFHEHFEPFKHDVLKEGSQIGSAVYFENDDIAPLKSIELPPQIAASATAQDGEPIFAAANRLVEEIKRAYTQILQEKEEQILQLKEEIADLRTLAQVLETENNRIRKNSDRRP